MKLFFSAVVPFVILILCVIFSVPLYEWLSFKFTMNQDDNRLSVSCDWFDPIPKTIRKFKVAFYLSDNAVEMYDIQAKKNFLKRIPLPHIIAKDLYIGNTIVVFSRQLQITGYLDEFTKEEMTRKRQRTFGMIKPDVFYRLGEVIQSIENRAYEIHSLKMVNLQRNQAELFYQEHFERPFFHGIAPSYTFPEVEDTLPVPKYNILRRVEASLRGGTRIQYIFSSKDIDSLHAKYSKIDLVSYVTSGPVIAMELVTENAVRNWRETIGPTDSDSARINSPESLRAKFGKDKQQNALHGSDSENSAQREIDFFFGPNSSPTSFSCLENSTCCIIKPHAVKSGNLGAILSAIQQENFRLNSMEIFRLKKSQAEEFLEVYDTVVPEFPQLALELSSGPLVALEIQSRDSTKNSVKEFRQFVGPMDSEMAKKVRPESLRARFGEDKIKNAIHCTDLEDDGPLEVEYFFKILQIKNKE